MKNKLIYIAIIGLFVVTGCGCDNRKITKESVTTDAPLTDIEKEVLNGEKGIQDNYVISNIKVENGKLIGTIQNKTKSKKSVRIDIMLMNAETYEQYGMVNIEVNNIDGNSKKNFEQELDENKAKANKFDARVVEEK